MSDQPWEPMIEGTAHLAYDSAAGAYHYDIRPPNAQYVRITTDLLLELVEAKVRTLPGRCVLVRHDLLGSHVEPKPEPAAIPRRVTSARVQTPPGVVIEGKVL